MSKLKIRILIFFMVLIVATPVSIGVLLIEQKKRVEEINNEIAFYDNLQKSFEEYRSEQQEYIEQIVNENKERMALSKQQYEELLQEQERIIEENKTTTTQYVSKKVTSYSPQKTQAPSKPKATTSTKAS